MRMFFSYATKHKCKQYKKTSVKIDVWNNGFICPYSGAEVKKPWSADPEIERLLLCLGAWWYSVFFCL